MAGFLILDSEALNALALADSDSVSKSARRARAVLMLAHELQAAVRIPAAVLIEVCRGGAADASINRVIKRIGSVFPTTEVVARTAGALIHSHGMSSRHAVDAVVVATAILLGGGTIATHDPDDLRALASSQPNVKVFPT